MRNDKSVNPQLFNSQIFEANRAEINQSASSRKYDYESEKFDMPLNKDFFNSESDDESENEDQEFESFFSKYDQIACKIKNKILDITKSDVKTIYRYCDKYLSSNIDLFIYIILECITIDSNILIRGIELLRFINKNYSHFFIQSFASALSKIRSKQTEINKIIILVLQMLYATFILKKNEIDVILESYLYENELSFKDCLFKDRFSLPNDSKLLQKNKDNFHLKQELNSLQRE